MSSVNKATILGRLGADPELKYTPTGQPVCELRVATSESYADKAGAKQERTEWHRVVAWGKTAENCAKFLQKGRQAYIEGKLQTRQWDDKDGKKHYTTEIVAQNVVFVGDAREQQPQHQRKRQERAEAPPTATAQDMSEDDIPF